MILYMMRFSGIYAVLLIAASAVALAQQVANTPASVAAAAVSNTESQKNNDNHDTNIVHETEEAIRERFRSYDELKKAREAIEAFQPKTDTQLLQSAVARLQDALEAAEDESSSGVARWAPGYDWNDTTCFWFNDNNTICTASDAALEIQAAIWDIEALVYQIDNGANLDRMGGVELLKDSLRNRHVVDDALLALSVATQGNAKAQAAILERHVLEEVATIVKTLVDGPVSSPISDTDVEACTINGGGCGLASNEDRMCGNHKRDAYTLYRAMFLLSNMVRGRGAPAEYARRIVLNQITPTMLARMLDRYAVGKRCDADEYQTSIFKRLERRTLAFYVDLYFRVSGKDGNGDIVNQQQTYPSDSNSDSAGKSSYDNNGATQREKDHAHDHGIDVALYKALISDDAAPVICRSGDGYLFRTVEQWAHCSTGTNASYTTDTENSDGKDECTHYFIDDYEKAVDNVTGLLWLCSDGGAWRSDQSKLEIVNVLQTASKLIPTPTREDSSADDHHGDDSDEYDDIYDTDFYDIMHRKTASLHNHMIGDVNLLDVDMR